MKIETFPPCQDHIGLWKKELKNWMPGTIFDGHVHLGLPDVISPVTEFHRKDPMTTFTSLTCKEIKILYSDLYDGATVDGMIAFPFPIAEVDIPAANDYIINLVKDDPSIKGFILVDPENVSKAVDQYSIALKNGVKISGVKAHYDLIGKTCYQCSMSEYVTNEMLEFINDEELALMLHTSGIGMADAGNRDFIMSTVSSFPRAKIILAHVGRYFEPGQFLKFMDSEIPLCPNIFLEMSSVTVPEVYDRILKEKKLWKRLIFGSDLPFGLISGQEHWSEETGLSFITRDKYSWSDEKLLAHHAKTRKKLTYNTYHAIHALKIAIERLKLSPDNENKLKEDIFYNNAVHNLLM